MQNHFEEKGSKRKDEIDDFYVDYKLFGSISNSENGYPKNTRNFEEEKKEASSKAFVMGSNRKAFVESDELLKTKYGFRRKGLMKTMENISSLKERFILKNFSSFFFKFFLKKLFKLIKLQIKSTTESDHQGLTACDFLEQTDQVPKIEASSIQLSRLSDETSLPRLQDSSMEKECASLTDVAPLVESTCSPLGQLATSPLVCSALSSIGQASGLLKVDEISLPSSLIVESSSNQRLT